MATKGDVDDDTKGDVDDDTKGKPAGTTEARLERVESAIERLGDLIDDALGGDGGDDGKGDTKGDAGAGDATRSAAQVEDTTEARVRAAVERLERDKATEDRLGRLEKAAEKIPRKVRKLTAAVWGKADDE